MGSREIYMFGGQIQYGITTSIVANAAASAVSIRQNMNKRRSLQPLVSTWAVFVLKLPKSFCVVI